MNGKNDFVLKYNSKSDHDFISKMLCYSNKNSKGELGYPRCDDLKELVSEIEMYENSLEDSICIIYHNEQPIALGGCLYTPGENFGYLIGPIIVEEYYYKESVKKTIDLIVNSKKNILSTLRVVVSEKNILLHESFLENGWSFQGIQREMRFDLENGNASSPRNSIRKIDRNNTAYIDKAFKLLDKAFEWNGDFDRMDELLKEDNKIGCIVDKNNSIMGVVTWAYLQDTDFSRLEYVAVEEKHRGRGIGEALINHVINDANDNKVKHIYLSTDIDNNAANLYKKMGFYDTIISKSYEKSINNEQT